MTRPDEYIFQHPHTHVFWLKASGVMPRRQVAADSQLVIPIQREAALAAIARWRARSLAEAELRHFNAPPLEPQAAY